MNPNPNQYNQQQYGQPVQPQYDQNQQYNQQQFNTQQTNNNYASFLNGVSPELMGSIGGKMIQSQTSSWSSSFGVFWNSLKVYFAVNNSYVRRKLLVILYPFGNKSWNRLRAEEAIVSPAQSSHKWALPREDINAPDLYIPLMSFASYILLVGLAKGVGGAGFTPELLIQTIWRCLFLHTLETLMIMFIVGFKGVSAPFLDLFSYTGYQYVGLCINAMLRLFGFYASITSAVYVSGMLAVFNLQSLKSVIPAQSAVGPPRHLILLACMVLQFLVIFILCLL